MEKKQSKEMTLADLIAAAIQVWAGVGFGPRQANGPFGD
jgi:hypothetical protein